MQSDTMSKDYYKTLGISKTASEDEIRKAYRKLARKNHPDLNPDDKAAKARFQDIQVAYDTLNDAEKRKMYDQFGAGYDQMGGNPFGGGGGASQVDLESMFGGRGGGGGGSGFGGFDLGDIFRQFGGQGGPPPGGGRGGNRQATPSPGRDLQSELTIPFATAVLGGHANVSFQRNGTSDSIKVTIPPGIEDGKKMRLRGKGESGPGGRDGDLIATIRVASHPVFKRKGKNLECPLPLTVVEALKGCKVDVPTPHGNVTLTIPPMSSSGRRLKVREKGVVQKSEPNGDLFFEIEIKMPDERILTTIDSIDSMTISELERACPSDVRALLKW
jgi:DnaJ-class molecular chaperone